MAPSQQKRKKAKEPESLYSPRVVLNPADCDLDFNIKCHGLVGCGLYEEGFAYCWSGARANVGIIRGRYCFGCKVVSEQPVQMKDTAPAQRHLCRVGVSRGDEAVGNLGESKHSFGFGGTGKASNSGVFVDFGEKFGVGDTIVCCINLEDKPATIGFSKNGKWLGTANHFDAGRLGIGVGDSPPLQSNSVLFPHVLLKNVVVQMQFSDEDGLIPQEGFKPWVSAIKDGNMVMGPTFSDPKDCEVMMMVGLPASGKTTWAEKWVKDHPEKRYVLLGTNLILDQMKVPGLNRKQNYGERFDRLMNRATNIFHVILSRAANTPHNYIIDQTNVYKSARKRKLKPFAKYQKIAVVVFPEPKEYKIRCNMRCKEMGKELPRDAVNNMIANYDLPKSKDMPYSDEYFDQVLFVELNRDESHKCLDQMKHDLASSSSNNSSTLSHGGSFQSSAGPFMQNQESLTDSGIHWQGSNYPPFTPCNYGMPNQVNADCHMTEFHRDGHSLSGVYCSNRIPHVSREPSLYGPYSNNESSRFPRDNAGYHQPYGVNPRGDMEAYSNSGLSGQYRSNFVGDNIASLDPYRSGMNEPSPYASARTSPFEFGTHGRPYRDDRDSLTRHRTPIPRPPYPYEGLPDYRRHPGRYAPQHPR